LLRRAREEFGAVTKSGLMVGIGENDKELDATFEDLARQRVQILTIGQYLAPSAGHLPVRRFVPPDHFDTLADSARQAGIGIVFAGPLVRSSYMADRLIAPNGDSAKF
jgi:lipoic acid synthetase